MRPLYEIDNDILACLDDETGEIVDENKLHALHMERAEKIEGVALWVKNLMAERDAIKAEVKAFQERARIIENKIEGLERYLGYACENRPFESARCVIRFRKSKYLDISPEAIIPEQCLEFQPPKVNKKSVKDLLAMGFEIEGVELKERTNISVK